MRKHMRAGERKSMARFCSHFSGARQMTAITYRFFNLIAPVALVAAVLGVGVLHAQPDAAGSHGHFGHIGMIGLSTAAVTPEMKANFEKLEGEISAFIKKHDEEVKMNGQATSETKTGLEKAGAQITELMNRMLTLEQKATAPRGEGTEEAKSVGELVTESAEFKSLKNGGARTGKINVGAIHEKTNVVNASGQNQPLVPAFRRPGIQGPGLRRLTVRDLLPSTPIASNLVEYAKENVFTNAAAMQANEGDPKAESALTFTLSYSAVQTLAHWIPVSRQLLEDAPAIQGYINNRLMYGLKLKEEDELLNGTGVGANLSGLINNATVYDTSYYASADTFIDVLLHAKTQVQLSYFEPDFVILNPKDWEKIQLIKTTGTASSGEYIFADPHTVQSPSIWGLPVVPTQSMAESQFLVGSSMAAMIWDRNDASIEISREHSDFFTRNLAAILVEERLALTVLRATALIYGGFPGGS